MNCDHRSVMNLGILNRLSVTVLISRVGAIASLAAVAFT